MKRTLPKHREKATTFGLQYGVTDRSLGESERNVSGDPLKFLSLVTEVAAELSAGSDVSKLILDSTQSWQFGPLLPSPGVFPRLMFSHQHGRCSPALVARCFQ